jgi:membrane-associated protease RseP (regulator of RpoE activity)
MTLIEGLIIFFAIIFIYFLIVYVLKNAGLFEKYNISFSGPILLLRTNRGKKFLEKIARRKRFWKAFGSFGIFFCLLIMIIFLILIFANFALLFQLTPEERSTLIPGPEAALPIPGLNPILPFEYVFYIILGLIIAMIVHEFSHGILSIVSKVKVKSLGLLYLIVPLGAFCEPDDEALKKTDAIKRMRVYAAGPLSNFFVAFICLMLFSFVFMSAVEHVDGADILHVLEGSPAEEVGIVQGTVIISLNDTSLSNLAEFRNAISDIPPHSEVNISYFVKGQTITKKVTLTSYYDYAKYVNSTQDVNYVENESHKNISYLGVGFNPYVELNFLDSLKNPFTNDFPNSFLMLYGFPFIGYLIGYNPIAEPFTNAYQINGPLGALPIDVFWVFVNALFWIFWLNLAVGIFNILPMLPLDGGFIFKDSLNTIVKKIKKDMTPEKRESIVKNISLIVSLLILFMIIFPFFIRYI